MERPQGYILGDSVSAARRLEIQDAHFADVSERLLDELRLRPHDRVVELGCGPGSFSRRILRRLDKGGVLTAIDRTQGLLDQARQALAGISEATFVPILADITEPGAWLANADVIVGRAVLHHVPMAELVLGRFRSALKPGTRLGFIEPDFRSLLGRLAYLETRQPELEPLRVWATAINQLYLANGISPAVGATLARTLRTCGFDNVQEHWQECHSDERMIENMVMFYDEVRDVLAAIGILSVDDVDRQQQLLRALPPGSPAAWATFRVSCAV